MDDLSRVRAALRDIPMVELKRSKWDIDGQVLVSLGEVSARVDLSQKRAAAALRRLGFAPIRVKLAGRIYRMWIGKEDEGSCT